ACRAGGGRDRHLDDALGRDRGDARDGSPRDRDSERAAARIPVDAYPRAVSYDALRQRARDGLLEGAERAGARAHFRAMGIDPARLGSPIVGIASTWTGT